MLEVVLTRLVLELLLSTVAGPSGRGSLAVAGPRGREESDTADWGPGVAG